jgi:RNA-directed DNA polymerase
MSRKRINIGSIAGSGKEQSTQSMSELLEKIRDKRNMSEACKKICANKGAGGVDDMEIEKTWWIYTRELGQYQRANQRKELHTSTSKASRNAQTN